MRETEILELMSNVGKCYKTDLMLYLKENNYGYSSTVIKNLLNKQYLEQTEILCKDDPNRDTIEVLSITKKGRIHLSDTLHDNDYSVQMEKHLRPRFSSSSIKEIHRGLSMSRILLFMNQAGIRTFPHEKPSIFALQEMTRGSTPAPADFYNNNLTIDEILSTGVFYTKDELNEFYNSDELKGEGDTFSGTRIRGVYIDRYRSCVIFQTNVFKSQTLKLRGQDEARALSNMRNHTPFCRANKTSNFDAIVLTNGSALIVDIGIGGKNGKVGNRIIGVGSNKNGERFLSYATTYYDNIYCFAHNLAGVRGLRYFHNYQCVQDRNDHVREVGIPGNFSFIPENLTTPGSEAIIADNNTDDNTSAIFVPYFNLKQLEKIRKMSESISIITQKEMADTISHILRKDNRIYDLEGNLIEVERYQDNGLKVGTPAPESKKKYYRQKSSLVHIEIPESLKDEIKQNAKLEGVTVSKYIRRLLIPAVKADTESKSEVYETKQQLQKDSEKHFISSLK